MNVLGLYHLKSREQIQSIKGNFVGIHVNLTSFFIGMVLAQRLALGLSLQKLKEYQIRENSVGTVVSQISTSIGTGLVSTIVLHHYHQKLKDYIFRGTFVGMSVLLANIFTGMDLV